MRIIPAIDIMNGMCVRLSKGDYNTQKIYSENPLEVAKKFEDNGLQYLHLVDLDGARSNHIVNHKVLYEIASKTKLKIDFGGGLKNVQDIEIAFQSGARQITVGSIAVNDRVLFLEWFKMYGPHRIILGADCTNRKIATMGWQQKSELDVIDFIQEYEAIGLKNVICTEISKDGMLEGTANELYAEILAATHVNLIASGGVSSLEDITALEKTGCEGVIIGKAIYEGRITLKELSMLC